VNKKREGSVSKEKKKATIPVDSPGNHVKKYGTRERRSAPRRYSPIPVSDRQMLKLYQKYSAQKVSASTSPAKKKSSFLEKWSDILSRQPVVLLERYVPPATAVQVEEDDRGSETDSSEMDIWSDKSETDERSETEDEPEIDDGSECCTPTPSWMDEDEIAQYYLNDDVWDAPEGSPAPTFQDANPADEGDSCQCPPPMGVSAVASARKEIDEVTVISEKREVDASVRTEEDPGSAASMTYKKELDNVHVITKKEENYSANSGTTVKEEDTAGGKSEKEKRRNAATATEKKELGSAVTAVKEDLEFEAKKDVHALKEVPTSDVPVTVSGIERNSRNGFLLTAASVVGNNFDNKLGSPNSNSAAVANDYDPPSATGLLSMELGAAAVTGCDLLLSDSAAVSTEKVSSTLVFPNGSCVGGMRPTLESSDAAFFDDPPSPMSDIAAVIRDINASLEHSDSASFTSALDGPPSPLSDIVADIQGIVAPPEVERTAPLTTDVDGEASSTAAVGQMSSSTLAQVSPKNGVPSPGVPDTAATTKESPQLTPAFKSTILESDEFTSNQMNGDSPSKAACVAKCSPPDWNESVLATGLTEGHKSVPKTDVSALSTTSAIMTRKKGVKSKRCEEGTPKDQERPVRYVLNRKIHGNSGTPDQTSSLMKGRETKSSNASNLVGNSSKKQSLILIRHDYTGSEPQRRRSFSPLSDDSDDFGDFRDSSKEDSDSMTRDLSAQDVFNILFGPKNGGKDEGHKPSSNISELTSAPLCRPNLEKDCVDPDRAASSQSDAATLPAGGSPVLSSSDVFEIVCGSRAYSPTLLFHGSPTPSTPERAHSPALSLPERSSPDVQGSARSLKRRSLSNTLEDRGPKPRKRSKSLDGYRKGYATRKKRSAPKRYSPTPEDFDETSNSSVEDEFLFEGERKPYATREKRTAPKRYSPTPFYDAYYYYENYPKYFSKEQSSKKVSYLLDCKF